MSIRIMTSLAHKVLHTFKGMPIRYKLMLLIMSVSVIAVILTTLAYISAGIIYIKQDRKNELSILASIVGDKNAAALAFGDNSLVKANLDMFSSRASVIQACIYDITGSVYAQYTNALHKGEICPVVQQDAVFMQEHTLEVFHAIHKKQTKLGTIYIESDLKAVDSYIRMQVATAGIILSIVICLSYLLALVLQRMISKPIMDLARDTRAVFEPNNLSIRTRKVYYDELGQIADSFNKILEERERKQEEFFKQHQELSDVFQNSERTLAILDDEAMFPFKAAATFKQMLEMKVFGPVHASYIEYFNDVYTAEVELYHVLITAIDTFRLHSEILQSGKEYIDLSETIDGVLQQQRFGKKGGRISSHVQVQNNTSLTCYRMPLERMMIMTLSLHEESQKFGHKYAVTFDIDKPDVDTNTVRIISEFAEADTANHHSNDNYCETALEKIIKKLKNNEALPVDKEKSCVDFDDISIRNLLYSIYFLADINGCDVLVRLSSSKIAFIFHLPEVSQESSMIANN